MTIERATSKLRPLFRKSYVPERLSLKGPALLCALLALSACQSGVVGIPYTTPSAPLASCDGSGATTSSTALSFGGTGGCVSEVTTSHENVAASLRGSVRYDAQRMSNGNGGAGFVSYSLAAGRFEYAHALDVTGDGKLIAIRDNGFDMTHEEFTNKTVQYESGYSPLTITKRSHGTAVAGLAAGVADHGDTLGAAPEASLLLSSWQDQTSDSMAVRSAESAGAIVMNNSWNYVCTGDPFNECGVNDYDTSMITTSYRNALLDYAGDEGVVVFATSNEETQTQSALMPALPVYLPALEEGWLAVINLARDYDTSQSDLFANAESSVTLVSSGCLEAARWCIAADGTSLIAKANDPDGYETGTGTSYAAPRVSGAVALLAQAFPTLNAKELRNRLLVTADNKFFTAGDPLIQTMTFAGGVTHDYHWNYGHGFVDVRAALLPIGAVTTKAATGESVSLDAPLLVAGSGVGAAPISALEDVRLAASDVMGGLFAADASKLAVANEDDRTHLAALSALPRRDLGSERNVATGLSRADPLFDGGRLVSLQLVPGLSVDTRLPEHATDALGARLAYVTELDAGQLSIAISHLQSEADPIGLAQIGEDQIGSDASAIRFGWRSDITENTELSLSALAGVSRPNSQNDYTQLSDLEYSDIGLGLSQRGVLNQSDRLSLTFRQPLAATQGGATFSLETIDDSGKATLSDIHVNLAPTAREYEIGVEYQTQGIFGSEWLFSASHRQNAGHQAGRSALNLDAAVQFRF